LSFWQGPRSIFPPRFLSSANDFVWQGQADEIMDGPADADLSPSSSAQVAQPK
jgi:hypothetical protein